MRDLYYLSAVGQARREMVADIETTLKRKRDVAETTQARANDLTTVENRHKQQRDKLVVQHAQRKIVLGKMETQLAEQRRKIGNLERDEKQLSQLVDQLNRAIAAQEVISVISTFSWFNKILKSSPPVYPLAPTIATLNILITIIHYFISKISFLNFFNNLTTTI